MYRTCIFCNRHLGANRVLEAFPVGLAGGVALAGAAGGAVGAGLAFEGVNIANLWTASAPRSASVRKTGGSGG